MNDINDTNGKKINARGYILIASMLFGMFFGAGNLIFPIMLGAQSGTNFIPAIIGMLISAVGFPLFGIISMGISGSDGLMHMAGRVSRGYAYFFTCALCLTVGPLFAIPRCAAVSFETGIEQLIPSNFVIWIKLAFTALFFGAVLLFSLKPNKILDTIGKWLNPAFLILLGVLTVVVFVNPISSVASVPAAEKYAENPMITGFLQGYDTLDALASLEFGIVVISVIRGLGVSDPNKVAASTAKSGVFSMSFMAIIYALIALIGVKCFGLYADRIGDAVFTGGDAFAIIARHYLGMPGLILLALIVTFCCLKTAIGLVTSCSQTFADMFPKGLGYKWYAIIFTAFSFVISNFGLTNIIKFSLPVMYFLYPLAIVLILVSIFGKFFNHSRYVYQYAIGCTMFSAILDIIRVSGNSSLDGFVDFIGLVLPLYKQGLGWLLPAAIGVVIGLIVTLVKSEKESKT